MSERERTWQDNKDTVLISFYEVWETSFTSQSNEFGRWWFPNFLHHQVVLAAAQANKHVICEKAMATTTADARDMIAACAEAGVKLFYAEDWVFSPPTLNIR